MKISRFDIPKVLCLSLVILMKFQTSAHAEVMINTKSITVNATRGESVTRTLALRTNEKINNFKVVSLDLLSADNSSVLPAQAIKLSSPATQINPQELISLPIQFNLQNSASGEFIGEIALIYDTGEKTIPVIVKIKDPWPLPLTVLVFGIIIGMAVSAYSSQGKLSDEVTVNLENLRSQIDSDKTEARSFWTQADMYLNMAKQARDSKQIVEAQTAINNGKEVWNQWIKQRPNWLIQFNYYDKLRKRLDQDDLKDTPAIYIQAIDRDLEQVLHNAPVFSTLNELQKRLYDLSQQINNYIQLKMQLEKLKDLISGLEVEDSNQLYEWENKATELTQTLYTISQDTELKTLQSEINTSIDKVRALGVQVLGVEKSIDGSPEVGMVIQAPSVGEKESSQLPFFTKSGKAIASLWRTANGRLKLFYLSSYLISFTVLAGSGFNQLYWTKPTFGANGWGDYFALLALGFGAEATRNVVTQVARKADESSS